VKGGILDKAFLTLDDGSVYEGLAIGKKGTVLGEIVFTTNMTGYQEVLTDPSYAGQIVTFTYPMIGNYGVSEEFNESDCKAAKGLIIKEFHGLETEKREGLDKWLKDKNITGISEIDTRSLTQKIRSKGVVPGGISSIEDGDKLLSLVKDSPPIESLNLVHDVSTKKKIVHKGKGPTVALLDLGVKKSIINYLLDEGFNVVQYPYSTSAEDILNDNPDGIVVSPGPGDPKAIGSILKTVKILAESKPYLGICLGHQLLALAFGGNTFKLKFGHRGGNHPVCESATGKAVITTQNHGYSVDPDSLKDTDLYVTHTALNDNTVEGIAHKSLPAMAIQFHPEASPGPLDSLDIFSKFRKMIG
tara:strand:- start:772 stop:1848 length:1077 start_codon:yes stop_codon:yes gene_type:complete